MADRAGSATGRADDPTGAAWSEHDLDRRFALGPPRDELTQLAATLDGLLERLATSLRHEQRLSAELSHELRTPLASIAAEAQFALRHTDQPADGKATLEQMLEGAEQMSRDARHADGRRASAARPARRDQRGRRPPPTRRRRRASRSSRATSRSSSRRPAEPIRVRVEQGLVERILAPLIENAVRHANRSVRIAIARDGATVLFTVEDDGPGVASEEREAIFMPGRRGAAGGTVGTLSSTGAGLGLALARRLARTAGGDVEVLPGSDGGRFVVRLPGEV